ncbi:hypothetical protein [Natrinema salsiterrestre]|uniref:Uncharacterized protein n=1 Tax=Natrinema salsiterrestre TaxID=2950540 RepID=A0A9Q4KZA3_9EURY|nr:hypothetical protein [Natrinema salsiterrestre]MDF9744489.1 hypothetical protein [Natrinema salsiterrestre]
MSDLVEVFGNIEGAELRVVATLGSLDYEIEFIRDDVDRMYDGGEFDRAHRDLVANQVSADDFKRAVEIGDLECQLLLYEETIVFLFPSSRYEGIFASFDRRKPFPLLEVVDHAGTIPHLSDAASDGG